MPLQLLKLERIKRINYSTLRDGLRLMPELAEADRDKFLLKDLKYATLIGNPDFPRETTSKVLIRAYRALGFSIVSPLETLSDASKTLGDLAQFISENHIPRFPDEVSDGSHE